MKKYCGTEQATDYSITHTHGMLDTRGYTHTHTQNIEYLLLSH